MTQDEIIRMAREAGGYLADLPKGDAWLFNDNQQLERFAALVAAHEREKHLNLANEVAWSVALAEREACAKVCEERADSYKYATDPWAHEHISEANTCAAAIRARGEK